MAPTEIPFSLKGRRVWVAGHRGMVGSALLRRLAREDCELLTVGSNQLDLRRQTEVERWMHSQRPDVVFMAAARVGGILANSRRPADFLYDNLAIQINIAKAAADIEVKKFLFLGSSCIYPRLAPQPIPEEALLSGPLEPTNQWYAIAKISGLMQCQAYRIQYGLDFISAMPTNLYGPGDSFNPEVVARSPRTAVPVSSGEVKSRTARRGLGDRHATARIYPCRRLRRRAGLSDEKLFAGGNDQHWRGQRHSDRRTGATAWRKRSATRER